MEGAKLRVRTAAHGRGQKGCRMLDHTGGKPPRDAWNSRVESPLHETHRGPGASSLLPSISSCRGYGGANAPPCLSPPRPLRGWPRLMGGAGRVPPIPPSSEKQCLWLQNFLAGGMRGAARSVQPVPPQEQGSSGGPGQSPGLVGSCCWGLAAAVRAGRAPRQLPRVRRLAC